jgi:hypothetical protein
MTVIRNKKGKLRIKTKKKRLKKMQRLKNKRKTILTNRMKLKKENKMKKGRIFYSNSKFLFNNYFMTE